jgi:hypothetical protein
MTEYQERILNAAQVVVLGITTLTAISGHTNLAIAGISIYLTSLHITHMKEN